VGKDTADPDERNMTFYKSEIGPPLTLLKVSVSLTSLKA
jgi:hypothetical protein